MSEVASSSVIQSWPRSNQVTNKKNVLNGFAYLMRSQLVLFSVTVVSPWRVTFLSYYGFIDVIFYFVGFGLQSFTKYLRLTLVMPQFVIIALICNTCPNL